MSEEQQQEPEAPEATTPTVEVPEQTQETQPERQNGEERQSRRDRRAARVDTEAAQRERDEYKRQFDEMRAENARQREEMARLQGFVAAGFQQRENPVDKQIVDLEEKSLQHLNNAAGAKDPATARREMTEYHKLQRQIGRLEGQSDLDKRFGEFQQGMPDPEMAGMKVSLGSEFPWLSNNEAARNAADGYIAVLRSRGKPDNLATYREACAMAARDFGLGGHQPPTNGQRGRYSGAPAGEGAAGSEQHSSSIAWDDHYQKLAQSAFPQDDPDTAKAKWLQKIGPKFIASMRQGR